MSTSTSRALPPAAGETRPSISIMSTSRAARLVDMMEMEGIVSPAAGGKPREVLVDKGYFEEVDAQLR